MKKSMGVNFGFMKLCIALLLIYPMLGESATGCCCLDCICPSGGGALASADFYALMPGDNAATVAVGGNVAFPQNGPSSGTSLIARTGPDTFNLVGVGFYLILFQVSVDEAGQLVLTLDSGAGATELPYTVVGRATGASQIVGTALVQTAVQNSILAVSNPLGNSAALTITPLAGGAQPVSAHLVITRIK